MGRPLGPPSESQAEYMVRKAQAGTQYKVRLESRGDSLLRQDPSKKLYGSARDRWLKVKTLREASEACLEYIAANDLGSRQWSGGQILRLSDAEFIGRVSYNGRVWNPHDEEIKV